METSGEQRVGGVADRGVWLGYIGPDFWVLHQHREEHKGYPGRRVAGGDIECPKCGDRMTAEEYREKMREVWPDA